MAGEIKKQRASWSGKWAFILAAAASAVGLGNMWRFPYLAAKDGGGTFLLTYWVLVFTFGVSRLLLELIRAEALARGYHIITCPCAMHPEDKIDHILIPELRLAFLTDNRWHRVQLPGMQAVRCTRFLDRENLAGYRARLRFNERAAAELLEQATALMAQAKSCHDELETYYRTTVDFAQVDEAAARCAELFGLEAPSPDC